MNSAGSAATQQPALSVLMLEDSRFDAELVGEALRAAFPYARVQVTSDEAGFTAALAHGGFDLILSDYELPGYSGGQALSHVLAVSPLTPFIFVSGVIGEDNAVEMLKRGATDYVSKNRLERLPVVVERALRESSQREARELAERKLREAGALYARVVNSLRDYAVILMDPAGIIRNCNEATREIFGHAPQDLVGQSADTLFTEADRARNIFGNELRIALAEGRANDNRWLLRRNGTTFWAEGVVTPLHSDAGEHTGFSKIVRDGTTAHEQGETVREAKEEAERANRAKDRFLAMLSHELRTPLTPISAAMPLLEKNAVVPEKYKSLLPMIRRNIALEARLIDDLLDLSAISAGKVTLKLSTVDMHQLVRAVAEMVEDQVTAHRLRLTVDLGAASPLVLGDEARLHQVVWNMLRNAIKFTREGGSIVLRTRTHDGELVLTCRDDGIGIEPAALPRIFQPFEQADAEVSERYGGLGLGLAIARGLVREHEGRLEADSEGRGKGATFTLALPSLDPNALHQPDASPDPGEFPQGDETGWRLLLVEDNPDAADTMAMALEAYGYEVTHAGTCSDAIRVGRAGQFDIVLTDLGLPDGSGIEVGRELSPKVPVIALSGYGAPTDLQRSKSAGFSGHLVKPV
ncbi:MAG: response regulator, partial [Burkholderiaceae bacterium]